MAAFTFGVALQIPKRPVVRVQVACERTTTIGEAREMLLESAEALAGGDEEVAAFITARAVDGMIYPPKWNKDDGVRLGDMVPATKDVAYIQLLDSERGPGTGKRKHEDGGKDDGQGEKRAKPLEDGEPDAGVGIPTTDVTCGGEGCSFTGGTSGYCSVCWRELDDDAKRAATLVQTTLQVERDKAKAVRQAEREREEAEENHARQEIARAEVAARDRANARQAQGLCYRMAPLEAVPMTQDWTHWLRNEDGDGKGVRITSDGWGLWTCGLWKDEDEGEEEDGGGNNYHLHDGHGQDRLDVLSVLDAVGSEIFVDSLFSQPWTPFVVHPSLLAETGITLTPESKPGPAVAALFSGPDSGSSWIIQDIAPGSWPSPDEEDQANHVMALFTGDPDDDEEVVEEYASLVSALASHCLPNTLQFVQYAPHASHSPWILAGLYPQPNNSIAILSVFTNYTAHA